MRSIALPAFRGNIRLKFRQTRERTVLRGNCLNRFEIKRCIYDKKFDRKLILSDGSEYCGYGFGSKLEKVTEIVFNTSPVGYQEILSESILYLSDGSDGISFDWQLRNGRR